MQGLGSLNFWFFQGPKHLGLASKGTGLHGALDVSSNHSSQTPSSLSLKLSRIRFQGQAVGAMELVPLAVH